jgi:hypothetical protein
LDDIIPNEVLVNQIQKKARDIFYEQEEHESVDITCSIVEEGREYDFNGRAFEKDVANLLNNESYLQMLKNGATDCSDWKFSCFSKMIKSFGLIPTDIIRIEATSEKEVIGLLPSGGQPKTDVWAIIFLTSGEKQNITISCKRTIRGSVSVHQYTADKFADVLDPNNDSLRVLLNIFQFYANARDMPNADRIALKTLLQPLLPKLCRWVLGGFGGDCSSPIQYANYLISYNPTIEYFGVHSVEDYTKMLLKHSPLAFGTPFGWTYASKQRQRSIQLKMPIIRDE